MRHLGTRELQTARLVLRRHTPEDAGAMYTGWASDAQVVQYLSWPVHDSVEASRKVLADWADHYGKANFYQWAITVRENGDRSVGSIGVTGTNDRVCTAEVGYCLAANWWNRGVTSEALGAVIHFLFEQVGVNRIQARHDTRNPHSGAVMRRCGMQYEGTLREAGHNNQGVCDEALYAILKREYGG